MRNNLFTILLLVLLLAAFILCISGYKNKFEVLDVLSSDIILVDLNHNGVADNDETICVSGVEGFEFEPDMSILSKYQKLFKLNKNDAVGLWYLGREFGRKNLLNKKISLKQVKIKNHKCKEAKILIDGADYGDLLFNSGFGLRNFIAENSGKFGQNLDNARKLNLVVLNHHSNKYHTLDCEYGNMAHDKIIIPFKQLPKGMSPCHFCHSIKDKKHKSNANLISNVTAVSPALKVHSGNIAIYRFDYTKHLKPNSDCNTDVCRLVVDNINRANDSVDIAIYGYDDIPAISTALKNAKQRGVRIRYVYDESSDNKTFYKNNDIIKNLSDVFMGDKHSKEANKIMHNKFIIFDDKSVITGSMNFSPSGLSGYDINDVVVLNSEPIAQLYKEEFEQMLSGKFHNAKFKHNIHNKFIMGNSEIEVYFSPQDKAANRIIELIHNSRHYIYVPTFLITHKGVSDALIQAQKRGIDVKIIIDANSVNTRNTKHKILRDSGIALKAENYAGKLHSKSMIIDDEYIIVGSMNFSNSGENKNDENMLVIKNNLFAKNYKVFFLYLWRIIPDKYLKSAPRAESFNSIGSCSDGVDNNFDGKIDISDDGCKKK